MRFDVFQYRLPSEGDLDDLNGFLATHRVISVTHRVVDGDHAPLLVFVVESVGRKDESSRGPERRVDYREKLKPADFGVFCRLRDLRKELADREGVPVYAIFSNAQLAEMAERGIADEGELAKVEGVGEAKLGKYGRAFCDAIRKAKAKPEEGGK